MQHHSSHRPMFGSLTSANAEFNRWLSQNRYSELPDASGQLWTVNASIQIFPDPVNLHAARHRLSIELKTQISRKMLIEKGTLDPSKDQRLLRLMDNSTIAVVYQRPAFETDTADKMRTQVAEELVKIKKSLLSVNLSEVYRREVGRLVDKQFHMAYPPITSHQIKIDLEL